MLEHSLNSPLILDRRRDIYPQGRSEKSAGAHRVAPPSYRETRGLTSPMIELNGRGKSRRRMKD